MKQLLKPALVASLVINLVLGYILLKRRVLPVIVERTVMAPANGLSAPENFKAVFVAENDSVYRRFFNDTFEGAPLQSYLLACAYYVIKKDSSIKNDIRAVSLELKRRYGQAPGFNP